MRYTLAVTGTTDRTMPDIHLSALARDGHRAHWKKKTGFMRAAVSTSRRREVVMRQGRPMLEVDGRRSGDSNGVEASVFSPGQRSKSQEALGLPQLRRLLLWRMPRRQYFNEDKTIEQTVRLVEAIS